MPKRARDSEPPEPQSRVTDSEEPEPFQPSTTTFDPWAVVTSDDDGTTGDEILLHPEKYPKPKKLPRSRARSRAPSSPSPARPRGARQRPKPTSPTTAPIPLAGNLQTLLSQYVPGALMNSDSLYAASQVISATIHEIEQKRGITFNRSVRLLPEDSLHMPFHTLFEQLESLRAEGVRNAVLPLWLSNPNHFVTLIVSIGETFTLEYDENLASDHPNLELSVRAVNGELRSTVAPRRCFTPGTKYGKTGDNSCGVCVLNNFLRLRLGLPLQERPLLLPRQIPNRRTLQAAIRRIVAATDPAVRVPPTVEVVPDSVETSSCDDVPEEPSQGTTLKGKTPKKGAKIMEHRHSVYPGEHPKPTRRPKAKVDKDLGITRENFTVRVKTFRAHDKASHLEAELAASRGRERKLLDVIYGQSRTIHTLQQDLKELEEPERKSRGGRPPKQGARARNPFNADLSRSQPYEWGLPMINLLRFLSQSLRTKGFVDLRNDKELRQCLNIQPELWARVINTENTADLLKPIPRMRTLQEVESLAKREIIKEVAAELPYRTTEHIRRALEEKRGIVMSKTQIRSHMAALCVLRRPRSVPDMIPEDFPRRLQFAEKYRPKQDKAGNTVIHPDCDRLVFSDECRFTDKLGIRMVWCFPGESAPVRRVHRPDGLMVWLCIGNFGAGRYIGGWVWYEKGSTQDSAAYIETLKAGFEPQARVALRNKRKLLFMQDGAGPHRSKVSKAYFKARSRVFDLLTDWPPRSPDLNPIENMWSWLKMKLMLLPLDKRSMTDIQNEVNRLILTDEANDHAKQLLASFPKRCEECCQRGGGPTSY